MPRFFLLPESPEHASWLTPEEKALAAARIKSENVGSTEVIDQMHGSVVRHAMFNPTTLINCFIFLLDNIVVQGLGFFLPTSRSHPSFWEIRHLEELVS